MAALNYDLHIEAGSDYRLRIPVLDQENDPVNLNGWSFRGQIRATHGSPFLLYDLTEALSPDVDDVHILLQILASTSARWAWTEAVYDVEVLDAGGSPYRLMEGRVFVTPEVTR